MNFLSHYFFERHHASAYAKLGVIMPDLVHGYNKYMRRAVEAYQPALAEHKALKEGLLRHHEVDRIFHAMGEFEYLQAEIKSLLKVQGLLPQLPRYWFMAHVAVEMLIDRNLMKLYPHLHVEFYNALATVSQPVVENYFIQIGCKPLASGFFGNFKVFTERRFLEYYLSDNHFTEALFGAWYRATGNKAGHETHQSVKQVLLEVEKQHSALLVAIPDMVFQQLKIAT